MKNQVKALKVKIKSLAEEARIIRLEERRAMPRLREENVTRERPSGLWTRKVRRLSGRADATLQSSLWQHRVNDVRKEQRSALLAYAFLRGKDYKTVEPKAVKPVDVTRVKQLVDKFGAPPTQWPPLKTDPKVIDAWLAGIPAELATATK